MANGANDFKKSGRYIKTELLEDIKNPLHFITIDYWNSQNDSDSFYEEYLEEYNMIDRTCISLTETENFIGNFEL